MKKPIKTAKSSTDRDKPSTRQSLSLQRITDAAIELADNTGVDTLTIRKLATALGVKPMAIYHYVSNKDEILNSMVDSVFSEIELPPVDADWKQAIAQRARSARKILARHPWAVPLMDSRRSPGRATLRQHNAVIGCLRNGGLSVEMAAHAYAVLDSFIYGFVIQESSLPATSGSEMEDLAEEISSALSPDEFPYLIEMASEHIMQPGYDFGDEFEFGLLLVIEGLDAAASKMTPSRKR